MADHRNIDAQPRNNAVAPQAEAPAPRHASPQETGRDYSCDVQILANLRAAALDIDKAACSDALQTAYDAGISREDIADFYIPELSREMGQDWCEDNLGFAAVTIGVSRLQAMLRELGPFWSGDRAADAAAPAILLVVPPDVHHTLGAMVLAGQLRRKGFSVRLLLAMRTPDVVKEMQRSKFNAVFVSTSPGDRLETVRRIVDVVRVSTANAPPVVVGGGILQVETKENLTALTGADYATNDPDEALSFCGLSITPLMHSMQTKQGT